MTIATMDSAPWPVPRRRPASGRVLAIALLCVSVASPAGGAERPDAGGASLAPSPRGAHSLDLLGADAGVRISMDYLGYDPASDTVWAPGGNTGRVFVVDARTEKVRSVDGFPTAERNNRVVGVSSVTFGSRTAFIGNRANASVCAVDTTSLQRGACITLPSNPDGLAYVSGTQEVWATTPSTQSIAILGVSDHHLTLKTSIQLDGQPEGYAVDPQRGRFYTNLEDKNVTLAIDLTSHKVVDRWKTGCSEKGPRGLARDERRGLLFVACTDGLVVLSLKNAGQQISSIATGPGVDNPDINTTLHRVFVAAGGEGTLSIASYGEDGKLTPLQRLSTAPGARVVVADQRGRAFAADSAGGRLWISEP